MALLTPLSEIKAYNLRLRDIVVSARGTGEITDITQSISANDEVWIAWTDGSYTKTPLCTLKDVWLKCVCDGDMDGIIWTRSPDCRAH